VPRQGLDATSSVRPRKPDEAETTGVLDAGLVAHWWETPQDPGETRKPDGEEINLDSAGRFCDTPAPNPVAAAFACHRRPVSSLIDGYLPMKAVAAALPGLATAVPAACRSALTRGRSREKTAPFAEDPQARSRNERMNSGKRPTDGRDSTPEADSRAARPILGWPACLVRLGWQVVLCGGACLLIAGCCGIGGGERASRCGSLFNPQPPDPPDSVEEFMRLKRLDP